MTAPAPYAPALRRLMHLNPVDYQDEGTQRHIGALATPLDDLAARLYAVALARTVTYAPEDALHLLGAERRIRRYPGEPLEVYRRRVAGAWDYWELAGTLEGLKRALRDAGYRASVIEHGVGPDRDTVHWADYSVYLTPAEPIEDDGTWDDAIMRWDEGRKWDFDPRVVPFDYLRPLIEDVTPAHTRLRRLSFRFRGDAWDAEGTKWNGATQDTEPLGYGLSFGVPWLTYSAITGGATWNGDEEIVLYDINLGVL